MTKMNKKALKKIQKILSALIDIRNGNRKDNHGICINLYLKYDNTDSIELFCTESIEEYFGYYADYCIEGSSLAYSINKNKWNNKVRLKLLDYMISRAELIIEENS